MKIVDGDSDAGCDEKQRGFTVAMIFGGKEWLAELQNIMSQVKSSHRVLISQLVFHESEHILLILTKSTRDI